ncbi:hypothetical protein PG989_001428 [Apiospora arundinis]
MTACLGHLLAIHDNLTAGAISIAPLMSVSGFALSEIDMLRVSLHNAAARKLAYMACHRLEAKMHLYRLGSAVCCMGRP